MFAKFWFLAFFVLFIGCKKGLEYDTSKIPISNALIAETELQEFDAQIDKKVYVPIYSDLTLKDEGLHVPLQATASLRNTDQNFALKIVKVTYFNTNGKLIREYLKKAIVIKPLASHEVVIRTSDLDGGSGAKLIVHWQAPSPSMNPPLIEAIFSGTRGSGAFSFTSRGVELQ